MSDEVAVLALRIAFAALLYIFLLAVAVLSIRELRRTSAGGVGHARRTQLGLVVLTSPDPDLLSRGYLELPAVAHIGRDETNEVVLEDSFVSNLHAVISSEAGTYWLEDLDSTNGTTVNACPVLGRAIVQIGDAIEIGHTKFRLTEH